MTRLKFHRDGYDYVARHNNIEYCVSKYFDVWAVWVNDIRQEELFDLLADAKEYCNKIAKM